MIRNLNVKVEVNVDVDVDVDVTENPIMVTTIQTHIIFPKVFFWIFCGWMMDI